MKQQFSLFRLETWVYSEYERDSHISKPCFEYIETFDTWEEAHKEQISINLQTLIIPTY